MAKHNNAQKRHCYDYVGTACIDGTCPKANREKYIEYGIPVINNCKECHLYQGCKDCILPDINYCNPKNNTQEE